MIRIFKVCSSCGKNERIIPINMYVEEVADSFANWICSDCSNTWEQLKKLLTWENTFYCRRDFADRWEVHNIAFDYGYIFFVFGESVFYVQEKRLDKLEEHKLVLKSEKMTGRRWATIKDIQ